MRQPSPKINEPSLETEKLPRIRRNKTFKRKARFRYDLSAHLSSSTLGKYVTQTHK